MTNRIRVDRGVLAHTHHKSASAGRPVRYRVSNKSAIWLVAIAFTVTMLGTTLPTPLYVLYQQRLGFSTLVGTVIFAAYAVGVMTALLLFGRISDVVGRRRTLIAALACAMASAVVFLMADDVALLLVGRVLSGVSAGLFTGTATATLLDLAAEDGHDQATMLATVANMGGLGLGPLLSGLLAQLAPAPLVLPYAVHLGLLALVGVGIWRVPETVVLAEGSRLPLPRLRVPEPVVGTFVKAAIAGFVGFGVLGLFTAVAPKFLRQLLELPDPALAGGVVCAVFVASAVGQVLLVPPLGRRALPVGCAVLVVGLGLLAISLAAGSLALLLTAGGFAGLGQGMSFRAGLTQINAEAPAGNRAEVASAFFMVMYVGISVPVVGVGLAAAAMGLRAAGIVFCAVMAVLALVALMLHGSHRPATNDPAPTQAARALAPTKED